MGGTHRVTAEPPTWCHRCEVNVEPEHWHWQKGSRYLLGGTWRCRVVKAKDGKKYHNKKSSTPEGRAAKVRWKEERYLNEYDRLYGRWKGYRRIDAVRGVETIERDLALRMMRMPCYYCEAPYSEGLDRVDNDLGHEESNVRPCCTWCNNIMSDLPSRAKDIMKPALKEMREAGIYEEWVPPTFRKVFAEKKELLDKIAADRASTPTDGDN